MSVCSVCHRELKSPKARKAGMGETCAKNLATDGGRASKPMKVVLLSRRSDGSRRWLVIDDRQYTVAIYMDRQSECECGRALCGHIKAAEDADKGVTLNGKANNEKNRRTGSG